MKTAKTRFQILNIHPKTPMFKKVHFWDDIKLEKYQKISLPLWIPAAVSNILDNSEIFFFYWFSRISGHGPRK